MGFFAFAYSGEDNQLYPPHGIRMAIYETWEEMLSDLSEFFDSTVFSGVEEGDDHTLCAAIQKLAQRHKWSLYSSEGGYLSEKQRVDRTTR